MKPTKVSREAWAGRTHDANQVRDLVASATIRLRDAGVGSPRVDAELLLAHCLGVERSRLAMVPAVSTEVGARYDGLVGRRADREPLQHILGTAAFRHIEVQVGPGVFVPRPETELLVDAVLPELRNAADVPVAVDLCAGSGALALALADEVPRALVYAVERHGDALTWLRRNVAGSSVRVVDADITDAGWRAALRGRADAVVSNPPYVPGTATVAAEVRHDPPEAVFAGMDGLALMPTVIAAAAELLRPGGVLAVEHDETHGPAVAALLSGHGGWRQVADHRDLAGRPRYATARYGRIAP